MCGWLRRGAYRLIMILYALLLAVWIALNFWMMPWHALQVGQASQHLHRYTSFCVLRPCIAFLGPCSSQQCEADASEGFDFCRARVSRAFVMRGVRTCGQVYLWTGQGSYPNPEP